MTRRTDTHPDLTRPDAGAPFFSTWRVGTPERQRQAVEAIARTWERRPWPADGLRSYHVYTGHDGETLLHHSQWASEQAYEAFVKTHRQERVDEIDAAVPGIERLGLGRYRRHGGLERAAGDTRVPGLVVVVRAEFAPEAAERRAGWTDRLLGTIERGPGLISAHFHLSTDGTHVLNYAEWESAGAYDDGPAAHWDGARTWPGLRGFTSGRYGHALGLVPGPSATDGTAAPAGRGR
ncbi:hypothetical protein SUDANB145_05589 [Streptomyces sp. enrichment culture]|uniref:antibiotic biosynthesis monooxygenase n=1 Tax=Streptomyces sp. enrichment culture TaxID=1795815 RepID=UPI003F564BCE